MALPVYKTPCQESFFEYLEYILLCYNCQFVNLGIIWDQLFKRKDYILYAYYVYSAYPDSFKNSFFQILFLKYRYFSWKLFAMSEYIFRDREIFCHSY